MGFIKIFVQQSIVMGPLSIRIPIYRGQIPPRGAPKSKLSLEIWIFRFGRVNPLLPAANLGPIATVRSSVRNKIVRTVFESEWDWESGHETRELIFANRWSRWPSIPNLIPSSILENRVYRLFWKSGMGLALRHGSPQPSFCTHSSFLRGPSGFPSVQLWQYNAKMRDWS